MSIEIQKHFEFEPGWYSQVRIRALVLQYYFVLRSVLRTKPCLRACLTRCRYCRIFFLTHPCNAGRRDLGCPFGCSREHRKRHSNKRSVEYYRTEEGKLKKKIQNDKRGRAEAKADLGSETCGAARDLTADEHRFDAGMVRYLCMVTSLIEGRRVSRMEILAMLARAVRQRSMVHRRKIDYVLQYWHQRSP